MAKKNPKVSVIIPRFLQMECSATKKFPYFTPFVPLKECIESVKNQDYKNKEIIFTKETHPKGTGAIRNEAIKKATGDIILCICPDSVMVGKNCISNFVKVFNERDVDVVVGSSIPSKKLSSPFVYLLTLEYAERERNMGEGYTNAGATSYFAIKKDVLKKIGGFPLRSPAINTGNPLFDSGFPDWDICGILVEKGYKIWHTNKAKFYHIYQTDAISYFKKQMMQTWYRVAYLKRFKVVKEGYISNKIIVQPFLFLLLPVWLALGLLIPSGIWPAAFLLNLLAILFWDVSSVLSFYKKTKNWKVALLFPISFIRSFSWLFGVIKGIIDFYILKA
ncbi:MAG: glycosyltransferase [Candidatus Aenigmatarchaeota archaeon]